MPAAASDPFTGSASGSGPGGHELPHSTIPAIRHIFRNVLIPFSYRDRHRNGLIGLPDMYHQCITSNGGCQARDVPFKMRFTKTQPICVLYTLLRVRPLAGVNAFSLYKTAVLCYTLIKYDRIKELGIAAQMTEIRFIQVFSPYWYFTFMDPDGNPIEITGSYAEEL